MTEGVKELVTAKPDVEVKPQTAQVSDKEMNFRRVEAQREEARDRAVKAEMEAALLKQRLDMMEARNQPKEIDPLDSVEDYVDPKSLKASLEQREKRFKREAEDIAERKFKEYKQKEEKQNHMQRLRSEYTDFGTVMTEDNVVELEKTNPEFVQSLLHIEDDYERKRLAYNYIKRNARPKEDRPSIKDKVQENLTNPYYIPASTGTPSAVDFDLKSPKARQDAYAKLKAAQRRPIGGGLAPS